MVVQKQANYTVEIKVEGEGVHRTFLVDAFGTSEAVAKTRAVLSRETEKKTKLLNVFKTTGGDDHGVKL